MVWVVMILKSMFRSITPSPQSLDGTIALATDYGAFEGSKITLVKPKETLGYEESGVRSVSAKVGKEKSLENDLRKQIQI